MGRILEQEGVVLENSLEKKKRERERNEENNPISKRFTNTRTRVQCAGHSTLKAEMGVALHAYNPSPEEVETWISQTH